MVAHQRYVRQYLYVMVDGYGYGDGG
jgi:hypothetical protein